MKDRVRVIEKMSAQAFSLDTYLEILEKFESFSNSATDDDFKRKFNGFYKVRRGAEWRQHYYELFYQCKNLAPNQLTFEYVIQALYEKTGKVEASFASKMLATIDTSKPIWDKFVLLYLELPHQGNTPEEKLQSAIDVYSAIEQQYTTEEFQGFIHLFNDLLPNYKSNISDTKKIDCFVWLLGMSKK